MASSSGVSSLGVGAGLDLNSLLTKLMTVEQQPIANVQNKISTANAKISAFGQLKTKLASLQTAAQTLSSPTKSSAFTASTSTENVVSATAAFNASAGTYNVHVDKLAVAQKDFSQTFASGTVFGAGTLSFTVNGTQKDITLAAGSYSLNDVRAKINAANIGISASVISDGTNDRMVFTATSEGTTGTFSLAVSSASSTLSALQNFDRTTAGLAFTDAQDASLTIDGVPITAKSNTLTTAINGLTIKLEGTGDTKITVASDSNNLQTAAQALVDGYNAVISQIRSSSSYDSTTKKAQPLNAESSTRTIQSLLSQARTATPTGLENATIKSLTQLGISAQKDGTLALDTAKFQAAVSAQPTEVQETLKAFGSAFDSTVEKIIGTNGILANRVSGLNNSITLFNDDITSLQRRVDAIEKRYRAQFTNLDTTVSSMQTTSSYLAQQLTSLQRL